MATYRIKRKHRYVHAPSEAVNDPRLSFRARGVLVYLLDKPDDWRPVSEEIASNGSEGRDAIRTALRELEDAGYIQRQKVQDAQGRWTTITTVFDTPTETGEPETDSQSSEPKPGKPTSGYPNFGGPGVLPTTEDQLQRTTTNPKAEVLRTSRTALRPARRGAQPQSDPDGGVGALWDAMAAPRPVEDEPVSTTAREPGAPKQARRPVNPDSIPGLFSYWRTELTKRRLWAVAGGYDYVAETNKLFGALLARGSTHEQIRRMIDMFLGDSSIILNGETPVVRKFKVHANRVQHRVKQEAEQAMASPEDYVSSSETKVYDMSQY